jgi:probable F420-dependent oxidoreductase
MKVRFAVAPAGAMLSLEELAAFAGALEGGGFDGVWLSDLPMRDVVDPLLGLAAIASRTTRLKLGANVVPLGRNPFLLAKALAQLDRLSGGRLLLSFVPGLDEPGEREALGLDGAARGATLERTLAAVRGWWDGDSELARPQQRPLEVWLGGRGPKALERAGRIADGWLGSQLHPTAARAARESIQSAARDAGREIDPEHFGLSIPYAHREPTAHEAAALRARAPAGPDPLAFVPVGADGLRALLAAHLEAGLSKFVLRPALAPRPWDEEIGWLAGVVLDLQS